jgi:hypothetical protein
MQHFMLQCKNGVVKKTPKLTVEHSSEITGKKQDNKFYLIFKEGVKIL